MHHQEGVIDLWSTNDGIFPASRFGSRYGICEQRFEVVLRFCPLEEFESLQDRWAPVHRQIEGFDKRLFAHHGVSVWMRV